VGKIINFHLPASDVERAAAFYRTVFGWTIEQQPGSVAPYLVTSAESPNGPGIDAAIVARTAMMTAPVPTIEVTGIDGVMARLAISGGQQSHVQDIPGIGRFGYAKDSEGNLIALLERSPEA
jgi:predicted enzyme related to lactoylglutathione lyase